MSNPLLDTLSPIAEPLAPGFWPLAYGWWLLIVLVITLSVLGFNTWLIHRRFWSVKRLALTKLANCTSAAQINQLIKQVAIHYFEHVDVAPLQGERWTKFLSQLIPHHTKSLTHVINGLYQAPSDADFTQYRTLASHWLNALSKKQLKEVSHA